LSAAREQLHDRYCPFEVLLADGQARMGIQLSAGGHEVLMTARAVEHLKLQDPRHGDLP
jgi:hypothetical protein